MALPLTRPPDRSILHHHTGHYFPVDIFDSLTTPKLNLDILRAYISDAITYLVNVANRTSRKGTKAIRGNYWSSRPLVFLLNFYNQPRETMELLHRFGAGIGRILLRSP